MLAFRRAGEDDRAAQIAEKLIGADDLTCELAQVAAAALLRVDRVSEALLLCDRIPFADASPRLHLTAAQALLACDAHADIVIERLRAAEAKAPNDLPVLRLLGEVLLKAGRMAEAETVLGRAVLLDPASAQLRILYARALKFTRRPSEAADHLLELVQKHPGRHTWTRETASALVLAGRSDEARSLFSAMRSDKRASLANPFNESLLGLFRLTDRANLPQARLDRAWEIALRLGATDLERHVWERRVRWGNLADLLILDWLECNPERVDEVVVLLSGLDRVRTEILDAQSQGKGVILAAAHLGPLYTGPLALNVMGVSHRWLASAPSISEAANASTLISTSDQSESQVTRSVLDALQSGHAVTIALDGASNPAAPRTTFEGAKVTYSSFGASLAYRYGVPCLFTAPYWSQARIEFTVTALPMPESDEAQEAFANRWREAYLACVRDHFQRGPENLRLSGGIWRGLS